MIKHKRRTALIATTLWFCLQTTSITTFAADGTPAEPPPATPPNISEEIEQKTREAVDKLIQMLSKFIDNIPQYAMPEVLANGDIIIRRKHPDNQPTTPSQEGQEI